MSTKLVRQMVKIDEEKCDGCGICIPSCHEGAIQIIDGKARLVADNLCDGLGNCLGTCPQDAITVEERTADAFDEAAVEARTQAQAQTPAPAAAPEPAVCGCPGSMARQFTPPAAAGAGQAGIAPAVPDTPPAFSRLGHWPIQLMLLPPSGPLWENADVLIAADCVAFAMPDFHERLLAGKTVAIGCPKLDDISHYTEKLTTIFANNSVKSVTVAHMEVPCCNGILMAAEQAVERAGRKDLQIRDLTIATDGEIL